MPATTETSKNRARAFAPRALGLASSPFKEGFRPAAAAAFFASCFILFAPVAGATAVYTNTPNAGTPTDAWISSGMLNADKLPTSPVTATSPGSITYAIWPIYTWFGSGNLTILCKVNGSTIDSATIPRSALNQTFGGSLTPYGSHSYIWATLNLTSIPWAGSGCNYTTGDTVQLDEWNGSGHNFVAPYDGSSMAIGEFGTSGGGPAGDGDPSTHAIAFTAPALFATSTSPVTLTFDYQVGTTTWESGSASSTLSGYRIQLRNQVAGTSKLLYGALSDVTPGTHSQTLTATLGTGSWYAYADLNNWTASLPVANYDTVLTYHRTAATDFGIDFNDNVSTVVSFTPNAQSSYASTSCQISFAGTFDLPQCIGYLIVPSTGSSSPIANIKNLTLARSFPFAYAYQIPTIREALFNSSTTASTTIGVDIPWFGHTTRRIDFLSASILASVSIAPEVKLILSWLLWLMLAELAWYQIIRSHDKTTPK